MLPNNILTGGNNPQLPAVNLPLLAGLGGRVAGGLTFSRASSVWGTNDAGVLVQAASGVPFFNSKGILLEPASTNKCTCYGTIPVDTLGAERVVNGGFDTDTIWSKNVGWTIAGGVATCVAAPAASIYANFTLVKGRVYRCTFTIVSVAAGGARVRLGFSTIAVSPTYTAPGTYTVDIAVASDATNGYVYIEGLNGFNGTVDNVSVKEVQYAIGTKTFYDSAAWVQNHTNMTLSGDTAAILTTVDDTAALAAAGLSGIAASGKVYKLDNSAGVGDVYVNIVGPTGNMNAQSFSVFARGGAGSINIGTATGSVAFGASPSFARVKSENVTATGVSQEIRVHANAGQIVYFLLPQLEELPACTSPMPCQGATATRAATILSFNVAGNLKANDFTVYIELTPTAVTTSNSNFFTSGNTTGNGLWFRAGSTGVTAGKTINGAGKASTVNSGLAAGITKKVVCRVSSLTGVSAFAAGLAGASNADTTNVSYDAPTVGVGYFQYSSASNPFYGYIKNLRIYRKSLSDAKCVSLTT